MSKIQKALEALRSGGEHPGATRDRPVSPRYVPASNESRAQTGDPGKGEAQSRTEHVSAVERLTPRQQINVDFERLVDCKLLPDGFDKKVISDQFRRIKRPILQSAFETDLPVGENANVIMLASALPGAGKSFCAFNLAHSISIERDAGAVLVDADVLKPSISKALGLQNETGLIDYLLDPSIELSDILVATDLQDIVVIPAGHKHPEATELLASRRMQELVARLSNEFAHRAVVFDTPPLLITNEAQVLAGKVGQIVLVIEARVSSQESVLRALSLLDHEKPINAILNKSRSASISGYHSDEYGYYPYPNRNSGNDSSST